MGGCIRDWLLDRNLYRSRLVCEPNVVLPQTIAINSSLLVLGKCISALVKRHHHVPYYESPLTHLLKAALGYSDRSPP